MLRYLIMKCTNLEEVLENDYIHLVTEPYAIVENYSAYLAKGFEIWELFPDGAFKLVKNGIDECIEFRYVVPYVCQECFTDFLEKNSPMMVRVKKVSAINPKEAARQVEERYSGIQIDYFNIKRVDA